MKTELYRFKVGAFFETQCIAGQPVSLAITDTQFLIAKII